MAAWARPSSSRFGPGCAGEDVPPVLAWYGRAGPERRWRRVGATSSMIAPLPQSRQDCVDAPVRSARCPRRDPVRGDDPGRAMMRRRPTSSIPHEPGSSGARRSAAAMRPSCTRRRSSRGPTRVAKTDPVGPIVSGSLETAAAASAGIPSRKPNRVAVTRSMSRSRPARSWRRTAIRRDQRERLDDAEEHGVLEANSRAVCVATYSRSASPHSTRSGRWPPPTSTQGPLMKSRTPRRRRRSASSR